MQKSNKLKKHQKKEQLHHKSPKQKIINNIITPTIHHKSNKQSTHVKKPSSQFPKPVLLSKASLSHKLKNHASQAKMNFTQRILTKPTQHYDKKQYQQQKSLFKNMQIKKSIYLQNKIKKSSSSKLSSKDKSNKTFNKNISPRNNDKPLSSIKSNKLIQTKSKYLRQLQDKLQQKQAQYNTVKARNIMQQTKGIGGWVDELTEQELKRLRKIHRAQQQIIDLQINELKKQMLRLNEIVQNGGDYQFVI